jgi:AbrB family looped-hinge helix DNA binding protein
MQTLSFTRSLTQKGQVTIPLPIRKLLGLVDNEPVLFEVLDGKVSIKTTKMRLEDTFGAIKPLPKSLSLHAMNEIIADERAKKYGK